MAAGALGLATIAPPANRAALEAGRVVAQIPNTHSFKRSDRPARDQQERRRPTERIACTVEGSGGGRKRLRLRRGFSGAACGEALPIGHASYEEPGFRRAPLQLERD